MSLPPLKKKRSGASLASQIFLLYGEEDYLIDERINEFKKSVVNPSLNFEQIDGKEPVIENIISAMQTQPLLGGDKMIVIRNLDLKSGTWDELVPSLKMISPGTRVVFCASSVSKRSKLYKLIEDLGEVLEFKSFAEWEQDKVISWISRKLRSQGKEIDSSAAELLQEICGSSLRKLDSEIDKLVTFVGNEKTVKKEDVLALASPGEINVFALSNALAEKDLKKSLSAFRILFKNKVDLFRMLSLLATNYRLMLQIKSFSGYSTDPRKIAQSLSANPYFVRRCMEKAVNFTKEELEKNLEHLLEAGLMLKSGEKQEPALELLLTALCSSEKGR
jgi:DNA polymerase-3 subunit delta